MGFTASNILRNNVELARLFSNPVTTSAPIDVPAITLRALAQNQTFRTDERLEGGKCIGIKAWFPDMSGIATDVAEATTCATPSGNPIGTLSVNYDSDVLAQHAQTMDAPRCDNELTRDAELMYNMRICMAKIRKDLNALSINAMNAAVAANIYTPLPNLGTAWDAVTATPAVNVPKADFKWQNIGWFDAVVSGNSMGEHMWINGATNFYGEWWESKYRNFDANGPSAFQAYNDQRMFFDNRQLDQVLTGANTFAINPNSIGIWQTVHSPSVPTEFSVGSNGKKFIYTVDDPEVRVNRNGVLVPLTYHVELEEACSSRTALGQLVKSYKLYMYFVGGIKFAPAAPNGPSGVMKFKAV